MFTVVVQKRWHYLHKKKKTIIIMWHDNSTHTSTRQCIDICEVFKRKQNIHLTYKIKPISHDTVHCTHRSFFVFFFSIQLMFLLGKTRLHFNNAVVMMFSSLPLKYISKILKPILDYWSFILRPSMSYDVSNHYVWHIVYLAKNMLMYDSVLTFGCKRYISET